jgi:protein-tyrosine phosphatase
MKLEFANLLNARDLGGYATRDGGRTRSKSLVRADNLATLTPQGTQAILDYGVRTVIDLRWPAEAAAHPSPFQNGAGGSAHYVNISLLGPTAADWEARWPAPTPKEWWNCKVLDHAQAEVRDALGAIAHAPAGGVLFHCMAGKDRTGVIAALMLALAGVEPDVIAHDYGLSTGNLREADLAGRPESDQARILEDLRCPPEQVHNMLAHLEQRYGGLQAYLGTIGVSHGEADQLRARLRG